MSEITPSPFGETNFPARLNERLAAANIDSSLPRAELYSRLEALICDTPLIPVQFEDLDGTIYAKAEFSNPGESHYDRAYVHTLRVLETDGIIQPGDKLIEVTSGSAGISFAWLCQTLGYKAHIIVPPELPLTRTQPMLDFGAELEVAPPGYIPQAGNLLRSKIVERFKDPNWHTQKRYTERYKVITARSLETDEREAYINHSANRLTIEGFEAIGNEIAEQLAHLSLDAAMLIVGNWTSINGIAPKLRARWPDIEIFGLEDVRNHPWYDEQRQVPLEDRHYDLHDSFGSSAQGVPLDFADLSLLDDVITIESAERDQLKASFNTEHPNLFIGNTSAMELVAAREYLKRHPGLKVGVLFYDHNDRY